MTLNLYLSDERAKDIIVSFIEMNTHSHDISDYKDEYIMFFQFEGFRFLSLYKSALLFDTFQQVISS